MKIIKLIKQQREINTLKLRINELEELLSSTVLEQVLKAVDSIEDSSKLKEQNKKLRKQIKELKERL